MCFRGEIREAGVLESRKHFRQSLVVRRFWSKRFGRRQRLGGQAINRVSSADEFGRKPPLSVL